MALDRSIIDTLRKVLALTTSPVEGEATAAAAHLARLLAKHNLDVADLESKGAQAKPGIEEGQHDLGKAAFKWKLRLADTIADFYYCVSLTDHTAKRVRFAGRPDNVDALRMLYKWLIDQIARIANVARREHQDATGEHIDPLRWQVHFGEGAVERLGERLQERRARESSQAGTALAVCHAAEVSDYLEERYGFRRDGQETKAQREARIRREARDAAKAELLKTDPEEYYRQYPWERPETEEEIAKREAESERWWKQYQKKEARNEKRRKGRREKTLSDKEWREQEQGATARRSGTANGDKINLEPFIEEHKTDAKRRIA